MRSNIQYFVNEQEQIVVAKLTGFRIDAMEMAEKLVFGKEAVKSIFFDDKYVYSMVMRYPDSYCGIAKCNKDDGDEWDVEYGKALARARLLKKVSNAKSRILYGVKKYMSAKVDEITELLERSNEKEFRYEAEEQAALAKFKN